MASFGAKGLDFYGRDTCHRISGTLKGHTIEGDPLFFFFFFNEEGGRGDAVRDRPSHY